MEISLPSVQSLYLETFAQDELVSSATAFVVKHEFGSYLITNYHVLSGCHPMTGQALSRSGATVDEVRAHFPFPIGMADHRWTEFTYPVISEADDPGDREALWLEHPVHGHEVDVVALPFGERPPASFFQYRLPDDAGKLRAMPGDGVNIVGFPYGRARGDFYATWVRGFVASEPTFGVDGMPKFLIDSRTHPGQSGSPVIAWHPGGTVTYADGVTDMDAEPICELLGVYSNPIDEKSDIGVVWRAGVIHDIIEAQRRGQVRS